MSEPDQIFLQCNACGGRLRAPREAIGSQVGCPSCHALITVRDPAASGPVPMISDPRRRLGLAPRGGDSPGAVEDAGFKDRFRSTSEPTLQIDPDQPVMKRRDWRKNKHGATLTEWDLQPRRNHRGRHTRRLIIALSAASIILIIALASIFWQRLREGERIASPPITAAGKPLDLRATSDFRDQVWQVVQQFCAASTPDALLPLIREPERVGPHIKNYYNSGNPVAPIALAPRPDLSDLEVHRNFVVFNLPLADFGARPIALEQTPGGFRVDWESFTGYSELSWAELRLTRPRHPVLLRAILKPSDYMNLDFPSAATHRCYQISDLHSDHVLYGYVPVGSDIELQIQKILLDAPQVNAVIRVRYPEHSTNDRQLEITEVLEKGWIFREDDIPETPLELSPLDLTKPPGQTTPASDVPKSKILPGATSP